DQFRSPSSCGRRCSSVSFLVLLDLVWGSPSAPYPAEGRRDGDELVRRRRKAVARCHRAVTSPAHPGRVRGSRAGGASPAARGGQSSAISSAAEVALSVVISRPTTDATTLTHATRVGPATNAADPAASATRAVVSKGRFVGCCRSHHSPVCIA